MDQVTVTQVRSSIGTKPKHRATLRALGLRGIGQTNTLPDRPEIRGMIARVPHLVRVTDGPAPAAPPKVRATFQVAPASAAEAPAEAPAEDDVEAVAPEGAAPAPGDTDEGS
jgi:large subunit ribosomal protein L30